MIKINDVPLHTNQVTSAFELGVRVGFTVVAVAGIPVARHIQKHAAKIGDGGAGLSGSQSAHNVNIYINLVQPGSWNETMGTLLPPFIMRILLLFTRS